MSHSDHPFGQDIQRPTPDEFHDRDFNLHLRMSFAPFRLGQTARQSDETLTPFLPPSSTFRKV